MEDRREIRQSNEERGNEGRRKVEEISEIDRKRRERDDDEESGKGRVVT